ncbi:hypothetical protein Pcinc_002392 [Petrolisthes cinctipes]|uniref:Uncharacterized protein n=1 Tax=Petrolisthes cinctipes TaxID=88211 RepID=A0AAE1L293_PETCI|nr:hypothetical protein Pcinc_002392 [Petrolisthes cinctipes]
MAHEDHGQEKECQICPTWRPCWCLSDIHITTTTTTVLFVCPALDLMLLNLPAANPQDWIDRGGAANAGHDRCPDPLARNTRHPDI